MALDLTTYAPMNPTFTLTEVEATVDKATIVIEPLEQGYGHTLGNALRRVLLSSLPGHAITSVIIDGIDHPYSTLEGMTEDVMELILNLKQVRIRSDIEGKSKMTLNVTGPKEVTAADIQPEGGYEIVNSELPLATLAKGKKLDIEMTVESGLGYEMVGDKKGQVIGEIPVDSLFSPVIKVSYRIEATRVGRRTDYDRIVLDVETDGSLRPIEAVQQAARILAKQFSQVVNPAAPELEEHAEHLSPEEAETLRLTVEELDLPTRIANALRKGGFKTVGDLVGTPKHTIAKVKNLGEKSVDVINEALEKKGVTLGD